MSSTASSEPVAAKFRAAWNVFAETCGRFWAPEASYQAWFAHYLISQFGIDRVAREPIINIASFTSALKPRMDSNEVRLDAVVLRRSGVVTLPHYANKMAKAADLSGLSVLGELAVISELKVAATSQYGLIRGPVERDADKLAMLLEEFGAGADGHRPLAFLCVLDNHVRRTYQQDRLEDYCSRYREAGVELLFFSRADVRPAMVEGRVLMRGSGNDPVSRPAALGGEGVEP